MIAYKTFDERKEEEKETRSWELKFYACLRFRASPYQDKLPKQRPANGEPKLSLGKSAGSLVPNSLELVIIIVNTCSTLLQNPSPKSEAL